MICGLTNTAQNQIYELHPIVGDTIDTDEINKYYLFKDYITDSIDYLILYKNKEQFTLEGILDNTSISKIQISKDEVLSQKEHVEKLNNYYVYNLKGDSVNLNKHNTIQISDSLNINLDIITPEYKKSIKKNMRRKFWEDKRKETKSNQRKGMVF